MHSFRWEKCNYSHFTSPYIVITCVQFRSYISKKVWPWRMWVQKCSSIKTNTITRRNILITLVHKTAVKFHGYLVHNLIHFTTITRQVEYYTMYKSFILVLVFVCDGEIWPSHMPSAGYQTWVTMVRGLNYDHYSRRSLTTKACFFIKTILTVLLVYSIPFH